MARQHTQHATQCTELAENQLSGVYYKRPMASKFAEYKPGGLSRLIVQWMLAQNKAENKRRTQGSASGKISD